MLIHKFLYILVLAFALFSPEQTIKNVGKKEAAA